MKIQVMLCRRVLTMMLVTLSAIAVFAQRPVVNFSATPTSGCSPLLVNFTDQSTGSPTSWRWSLGNGTISTTRNPSAVYTNPGTYTVKLIVTNSAGSDSLIRTNYVIVYAKPVIQFLGSNVNGCGPLTVSFTDNSSAGSGSIQSRQWDFGDGTFSNLTNPSHTYNSAGSFNVSLLVTNSFGCSASVTQNGYVQVIPAPSLAFTANTTSSCAVPLDVSFQNQTTSSGSISFIWNFGDGTTSTAINPTHSYRNPGSFSVKLKAIGAAGCSDSLTRNNYINIQNNSVAFDAPDRACVNSSIQLTSTSSPAPTSTLWRLSNGATSNEANPVISFSLPGVYYITKIDNFGGCIDSTTRSIQILRKPVSDFSGTNLSSCMAPLRANFTANSTNASGYLWSFGDGQTSTEMNPQHSYTQEGNFDVTLISTNNGGCADTLVRTAYVSIQYPVITMNNTTHSGCAPLSDTFSIQVVGGDAIATYLWNFGDGNTSNEASPIHVYNNRGSYDVRVSISTVSGCTASSFYPNAVKAGNQPHPTFEAVPPLIICASEQVQFTNLTPLSDSVDQWLWVFGDNTFSTAMSPTHLFIDTGIFDIKLLAYDNGCASDTFIRTQYLTILAPIAKFSVVSNCRQRLTKKFVDISIGAKAWHWDFGDGQTSDEQNPEHTYNQSGYYTVTLTVTNDSTQCTGTRARTILATNEVPNFEATPTEICRGSATSFRVKDFTPEYFSTFSWNFGDGISGSDTAVTKIYYNPGLYNVRLITKDKLGCRDTILKRTYITVNGPKSVFSTLNTIGCRNSRIAFSDNSLTDGRNAIVQRIWSWGDGSSDTLTNQSNVFHTYATNGMYTVKLTVVDATGCQSTLSRTNYITINSPFASFSSNDTITCVQSNVTFINNTTGSGNSYNWNFGDGQTSANATPTHAYSNQGSFSITLFATNASGCTDTLKKINYIKVKNPIASYTADTYEGNCPPLVVNFTNSSQNYQSQVWDFGDGTSTNTDNPSHFYAISGNYTAKVTVTSPGGCTSSYQHAIIVHGPRGTINYSGAAGCTPLSKVFQATTVNTTEMVWDFNDGNTVQSNALSQNHTYTTEGVYLPKLLLKDAAGCVVPVIGSDSIRVNNLQPSFQMGNHQFCRSGIVTFNNASVATDAIASYQWDFGDGTTSAESNPAHEYLNPGNYIPKLLVQTVTGCSGTYISPDTVRILSIPQGQIVQTAGEGCIGLSVRFSGSINGLAANSLTWNWDFGNGNTSNIFNPPAQTYRTVGTTAVKATITNSVGCSDTLRASVLIHPTPVVNAGSDTFSCRFTGVRLQAIGADTYTWTPSTGLNCSNCANPLANPSANIQYRVTGKTVFGCEANDTIVVEVINPFNLTVSPFDSVCLGQSKQLLASGAFRYSWTPTTGLDNPNIPNPTATPNVSTNYKVEAVDEKACFTKTKLVTIKVYPNPTVDLDEETTVTVGRTIDLVPRVSRDVIDARWSPTTSIFRTDFPGITVKPTETTTFTIDVFNKHRCTATDRITVNVMCNNSNMFIPNSFSPNGDGMNDIFYPRGTGIFTIKSLRIFSRWGEVIYQRNNFKANDPTKGWDGTFKGQKMNADAFVYTVEVVCENNTEMTFKGSVTLLR